MPQHQCVVVFITKRYTEKVAGSNAEDNCQLEFNYAALRKTATKMVSVVMEERMRDTRAWMGEVAMVLGGRLYVDVCSDLSDSAYLNSKADELFASILKVIGTPVKQCANVFSNAPSTENILDASVRQLNTKHGVGLALENLTADQVGKLLDHRNLSVYKELFMEQEVTGKLQAQYCRVIVNRTSITLILCYNRHCGDSRY